MKPFLLFIAIVFICQVKGIMLYETGKMLTRAFLSSID